MDQHAVRKLEDHLERAIIDVIMQLAKGRQVPPLPSHHTVHMMAKAACAVYEAAVEIHEVEDGEDELPE
jgi:hypothetical protein